MAERLRTCLRRVDTIARIGGDEFTVLLEDVGTSADGALVAERIIEAFRASFRIENQEIFVGASIGIALGGKDQGTTAQGLLRNADIAMYRAKANGRACFEVFKSSMRETVKGRLKMETELRRALDRGELRLHYQPQVDLRSARIVGWRRWSAGSIPSAAWFRRVRSSRSPRRRASSSRSDGGCSRRPAGRRPSGAPTPRSASTS